MRHLPIFLVLILITNIVYSQTLPDYRQANFVRGKDSLRYRVLPPEHIKAGKKYPVILVLHGSGERGNDNTLQLTHGAGMFMTQSVRNAFPAYVIFPQCPINDTWARTMRTQDRSDSLGGLRYRSEMAPTISMTLLMGMLDSLAAEPSVDKSRIYVGGLSMGGMGTFELLWRKPGFFAAAFPICGGGDAQKVPMYTDVPVWVFHGQADPVVPVGNSRRMVNALKTAGATLQYSEYPGVEHNSWENAFGEPGLFPWLLQFSRKNYNR